jgi:cytochrome c peroxidase
MKVLDTPPLGLPRVPVPADNPITEEKIELGKKLFFDRRLSLNDTISCAICHIPEQGFTSNEVERSVGVEGRQGRRNAQTIFNVAYLEKLFQDGREINLENQVWGHFLARNEMAMTSVGHVIEKVKSLDDYDGLFEQAFGGKKANIETIGQAIASYERTLVSGNSPFDRWYYGKDEGAISDQAKNGFELFSGKANCIACHSVKEDHALFTDNKVHNTGIGFHAAMYDGPETERMNIAPGVYIDVKKSIVDEFKETIGDLGYYEVTEHPDDRWKYRTPSLRNITLTAPYMHNGSVPDLRSVIEVYNQGGYDAEGVIRNVTQSPLIKPLGLTEQEIDDLIAFMQTLTGDNVAELISDANTVPVADTGH